MSSDGSHDRRQNQIADAFVLDDLRQMQAAPRYIDWLFRLIRPHVGRRVLEVGAGIGEFSVRLLPHVDYILGLEPNASCHEELSRAVRDPRFESLPLRIEECDAEVLASRRFDTVVSINVLEHIEDDAAAVRRFRDAVRPSGRIVLLVPAVPQAYGSIDRAVGHYRRYARPALRATLVDAGLSVESIRYSNLVGLLGWMRNARVSGIVKQSDRQIRLFDRAIVPWYSRLERWLPPPVGMSLVAVARRGAA